MQTPSAAFRNALPALGLCLLAGLSHAQSTYVSKKEGYASHNEVPVRIRYAGMKENMLIFDVYLTDLPSKSVLRILDQEGNLLHQETIPAAAFQRRYKINSGQTKHLRFEVGRGKTLHCQSFNIAVRIEEKLVVTPAK